MIWQSRALGQRVARKRSGRTRRAARAGTWWRQGAREESTCAGSWTIPGDSSTLFIPCAPASSNMPATSCDFRQTRAVGRVRLSQWLGVRPISGRAKMGLKDSSSPRCGTRISPREWSRAHAHQRRGQWRERTRRRGRRRTLQVDAVTL